MSRVKYHETGRTIHNIVEIVPAQEKIKKSSTAVWEYLWFYSRFEQGEISQDCKNYSQCHGNCSSTREDVRRVLLQYENISDSTVDLSRVKYHETGRIIHNIVVIVPAQEKMAV